MCTACEVRTEAILPNQRTLGEKLLQIGGERVVWRECEPHLDDLAAHGELMTGRVRKRRGQPNECHTNAAEIWASDVDRYQICTGYGLSTDGRWRQHSWLRDAKGLIETTVSRTHYFGIVLTPQSAAHFWLVNFLHPLFPEPMKILFDVGRTVRDRHPSGQPSPTASVSE
jgi:hypothetical protein